MSSQQPVKHLLFSAHNQQLEFYWLQGTVACAFSTMSPCSKDVPLPYSRMVANGWHTRVPSLLSLQKQWVVFNNLTDMCVYSQ